MNFHIVEVVQQKQRQQVPSVSIENGDDVGISVGDDGSVVIRRIEREV